VPDEFRHVIALLWQKLGLSRPSFQADDVAALVVDGLALKLTLTEDGRHILLSAKAGELSANPLVREQQVTRLLNTNLHTLLSSRACACVDNRDSQTPAVIVRAVAPCSAQYVDALAEAVSDVAYLAREFGGTLSREPGHTAVGPAAPRALPSDGLSDDMLVFRL
jgi:hypothetical protein